MAEITTTTTKKSSRKRINKKNTRVDLTPMVDLGFLLITFFVFTSTMAKPTAMSLVMPNDKDITQPTQLCESCALTVILEKDNRIFYYEGMPENHLVVKEVSFLTRDAIRKVLVQKLNAVKLATGKTADMALIIKPADGSSFKNFVDMVDEVTINNIKHYFVDEVNARDKQLIQ